MSSGAVAQWGEHVPVASVHADSVKTIQYNTIHTCARTRVSCPFPTVQSTTRSPLRTTRAHSEWARSVGLAQLSNTSSKFLCSIGISFELEQQRRPLCAHARARPLPCCSRSARMFLALLTAQDQRARDAWHVAEHRVQEIGLQASWTKKSHIDIYIIPIDWFI